MNRIRSAMTLLEAMITVVIFTTVMVAVFEALQNGVNTTRVIQTNDSLSDSNARALKDLVNQLRYADVNRIYLDHSAWTTQVSGSDLYSFKVCTGFKVDASAKSLDRAVRYDRGIQLRFTSNGDNTGSLYKTVFNLDPVTYQPTSIAESERILAGNLAWRYTPAGGIAPMSGFQIVQLDPTQASVVGNQIEVRIAALTGLDPRGNQAYRDIRSTVFLRSSMYDGVGLLAPVVTSPATAIANQASPYIYDIIATNDPTSFSATGLPSFLTCDPYSGRISGTPTTTGTWTILVTAKNDVGMGSRSVDLTIKGPLPQITSPLTLNVVQNSAVLYQTTATNVPISYGATNLPANLVLNTSTGAITGSIPTIGSWTATLTVANTNGSITAPLIINSTSAPLPAPVVTSGSAIAGVNQPFTYQIAASNSPTAYSATGLPGGLALNQFTGLISGSPTAVGSYMVYLAASNGAGTGTGTLNLTVQQPACVITSAASATATVGESFTFTITATNSPTSFAASGMPSWMTLNTATGQMAGVPTGPGIYNINLAATNSIGSGYATLALTVNAPAVPSISLINPLSATQGVLFSYTPTVAPAVPTTWTVSGLPSGMNLANSSTGMISGSPKIIGSYTVTFTATNAGGTSSGSTVLQVVANPNLPTITMGNNTANGNGKFQVLGTVAAATGMTLDFSTWSETDNQGLTLRRGWVASEIGNGSSALASNQFLLSSSSISGTVTITVSIGDTSGNIAVKTQNY